MTAQNVDNRPAATGGNAPVKATVSEGTEYVIIEASPADKSWKERGKVIATSAHAAIRSHADHPAAKDATTFIAIPARSWKPVKVTPQTVTTLKLEEAK